MVKDYRHRISKNNSSWDKAIKIFDKQLSNLSDDVLAEIFEIFQLDVPVGIKNTEQINKLNKSNEILKLELQIIKNAKQKG